MISHTNYQQPLDVPTEYIMADRFGRASSNRLLFDPCLRGSQTCLHDVFAYYGTEHGSKTSVSNYYDWLLSSGTTSLIVDVLLRLQPANQAIEQKPVEPYQELIGMSVSDQAREVLAALSINKSQLAEILDVSRPTLYSWFDGSNPNPGNSGRLLDLLKLLRKTGIQGTSPLNTRFVRQPLDENESSLIDLLKSDRWNEKKIGEFLAKARNLTIQDAQRNEDKNKRLRDLGYDEPTLKERKKRLELNTTMMGLNDGNER